MSGRGTPATQILAASGFAHRLHEYVHDPATTSYAYEASEALGVDAARVHKTLVVSVAGDRRSELFVAIVPADATCDLKAFAAVIGVRRVEMADPKVAQRATGYVVGGISPIGQRQQLSTVIDEDAQLWDTVFVSGGRRGLDIELAPLDLATLTRARFAAIAKR
jgi:Cys-tRNA(Pro)/Cys-tRNA(Cys) deacylase